MTAKRLFIALLLCCALGAAPAAASYYKESESDIDTDIFVIDELKVLGARIESGVPLIDAAGKRFTMKDMLGKPLVLVLAYYTCDGSCSVINENLSDLLDEVDAVAPGRDFRILTLSFDAHDTLRTTGAFQEHLELAGDRARDWTFATFENPDDIEKVTDRFGYKFFWSPRDRTFFHPGAFLFLSAEGRLARVLYALDAGPRDVELAVLDARQGQFEPTPRDLINFAASLCYSYNFEEGRYTYNIPLFVAAGSLTLGVSAFSVSVVVFRRRRKKESA